MIRLWCLQEAMTFLPFDKVREVGGDPDSPPGPVTHLCCSWMSSEKSLDRYAQDGHVGKGQ